MGELRISCNTSDRPGTQWPHTICLALRETPYCLICAAALFLVTSCSLALAGPAYQTGKLVSITDSSSNRAVGNAQSGSVVTVTDVEYRLSVEIEDMVYVGSYWPRTCWSYSPTDFVVNDPVQVKVDGKHMYIKRPGGKELKTTLIQRIRKEPKS